MSEENDDSIKIGQRVRVRVDYWLSDIRKDETGVVIKVMPPDRFRDAVVYKVKAEDANISAILTRDMIEPIAGGGGGA